MSQRSYNPVILAEMTRAAHAERPDADWHELEPVLRTQWMQMARPLEWDAVRDMAAAQYRLLHGLPDVAPVMAPGASFEQVAR